MKYVVFKLVGVVLFFFLVWMFVQVVVLCVVVDLVFYVEIFNYIKKIDFSFDLKVVELISGVNVNELLVSGDVDVNYFQYVFYLKDQEKVLGKIFVVVVIVYIELLGIYLYKYKDFLLLLENVIVVVLNNIINLSWVLFLLQVQKFIKLDFKFIDLVIILVMLKDIVENLKYLKILEIELLQILCFFDDVDLVVINGNYVLEVGLVLVKDVLGLESVEYNLYVNILVIILVLVNDLCIKVLVKDLILLQVVEFICKIYNGLVILVVFQL